MSAETKDKQKKRVPRKQMESPSPNGASAKHGSKRVELASEVASELDSLRSSLDEMTEHYRLRVAAQIGELLQSLRDDQASGQKAKLPPARALQPMLNQLRAVRLKPRKGRPKDFVRLEKLLDQLLGLVPPEA